MEYSRWKKDARVLTPCRVVGLALETLFALEAQFGCVGAGQVRRVSFWKTKELGESGSWSEPKSCLVPVLAVHQSLTLYILSRLYGWLAGLGLVVVEAVVRRSNREGSGHHDLKLKHAIPLKPLYCNGFVSMEVKVSQVGATGRFFAGVWDDYKKECMAAMARLLKIQGTRYGAAVLLLVGVCDSEGLLAREPPLLVKAQLLVLGADGEAKWGRVLLDRGTVAVTPTPPPTKRQRQGASWDEVRASLHDKKEEFDDIEYVRLLDLFKAISATKTTKNPGQKMVTYQKHLGLKRAHDFMQRRYPVGARGSEPYWLTWAAAARIYSYEVLTYDRPDAWAHGLLVPWSHGSHDSLALWFLGPLALIGSLVPLPPLAPWSPDPPGPLPLMAP